MKFEDFADLSTEEIINIKEVAFQVLKARNVEMENQAVSEVASIISKWNDRRFYFYIMDNEDCEIPIYPREIRVTREWI